MVAVYFLNLHLNNIIFSLLNPRSRYKFLSSSRCGISVVDYINKIFFLALLKPVSTKERTNSLVAETGESMLSTTSTFLPFLNPVRPRGGQIHWQLNLGCQLNQHLISSLKPMSTKECANSSIAKAEESELTTKSRPRYFSHSHLQQRFAKCPEIQ